MFLAVTAFRRAPLALLLIFLCAVLHLASAQARDEVTTSPILRIEAGMHTARVWRIAVDKAGRFLISASEDKTCRVFDARTGEALRILRPLSDVGKEGALYSVAITPDGNTVVCAGETGFQWNRANAIYVFERASGKLRSVIGGLPGTVSDLSFSPDGSLLAAAMRGPSGVRLFRVADGKQMGEDLDYGDSTVTLDINQDATRLATADVDGLVRLYRIAPASGASPQSGLVRLAKVKAPDGAYPTDVAFSPDARRIAIGYYGVAKVSVLDAKDLSVVLRPDVRGIERGDFSRVAWTADGKALLAGGSVNNRQHMFLRCWTGAGAGPFTDIPAAENVIDDLSTRAGAVYYAAQGPRVGRIDLPSGKQRWKQEAPNLVLTNSRASFGIDTSGETVQFGAWSSLGKPQTMREQTVMRFDLQQRGLLVRGANNKTLFALGDFTKAPVTKAMGMEVTDWDFSAAPKLNGKPLPILPSDTTYSLAFTPGGKTFLLGATWSIYRFDTEGTSLWRINVPAEVYSVEPSGDGKVLAAALGDGTLRWYRVSDGAELLSLFIADDCKRWVAWSPSGCYDCSPGGEDLIGWHLNRAKDQEADFFPATRFRETFYRPDIIARVLAAGDETEAIRLANAAKGDANPIPLAGTTGATLKLPPVIAILSPEQNASVSKPAVQVRYSVRTPADAPVTAVKVLIDGRPLQTARGLAFEKNDTPTGTTGEISVTLPAQDCEISLIAENANAASTPATVKVHYSGPAQVAPVGDTFVAKPKLYVLAVGVSKYAMPGRDLDFPAKDAKDFAAALKAQQGGIYREVVTHVLTDAQATHDAVVDDLEWVQKETTAKDVAMVFLSGHGANDTDGAYHFLSQDFDGEHWRRTAVSFSEIKDALSKIKGKVLFFVDTCHSGNVFGTAKTKGAGNDIVGVVNELSSAENGVIVFASSTGKQLSLEDAAWGNGAFTKAVVEAINGGADYNKNGKITVNMLDLYISERVKELTKGTQTPTTTKPATVPDFPVAIKR